MLVLVLAQALRSIGSNFGKIFGNQLVGWVVEVGGAGLAYAFVAGLLVTALGLLAIVSGMLHRQGGGLVLVF